jgi:hypothetical protein
MKSKRLGMFCCTTGPITAHAKIERAGYTPGETIVLKADTENDSGISLRGSKAQFVQVRIPSHLKRFDYLISIF